VRLEGLDQLEKSDDLIGIRTVNVVVRTEKSANANNLYYLFNTS
jgi:hypothetical protein